MNVGKLVSALDDSAATGYRRGYRDRHVFDYVMLLPDGTEVSDLVVDDDARTVTVRGTA